MWGATPGFSTALIGPGTILWIVRLGFWDMTSEGPPVMKKLLLTLAALASVSFAACEEKGPLEKAADEVEDVIDEAT